MKQRKSDFIIKENDTYSGFQRINKKNLSDANDGCGKLKLGANEKNIQDLLPDYLTIARRTQVAHE